MNPWGESVQSATKSIGSAVDEIGDLIQFFNRNIAGADSLPDDQISQVGASLIALQKSLQQAAESLGPIADLQGLATLTFLAGKRLNREQFYFLLMSESLEWTNKNLGLSDFEDFELFELLRYEGSQRQGYIYLGEDIDDLPDIGADDWFLELLSSTYRKAIVPPEEIPWNTLQPEQREFFTRHLPNVVVRFIHDE
jgi:hypothetical protein